MLHTAGGYVHSNSSDDMERHLPYICVYIQGNYKNSAVSMQPLNK